MEAVFGSDSDSESFVDDDCGIREAAGVEGEEPEDEGEKPKDTDDEGEQSQMVPLAIMKQPKTAVEAQSTPNGFSNHTTTG